jgi:hypothetical protein
MPRIDRAFFTSKWEEMFGNLIVQALSSSSDHCPLMLMPLIMPKIKPKFKFDTFWTHMPGFFQCVDQAWNKAAPNHHNPLAPPHKAKQNN